MNKEKSRMSPTKSVNKGCCGYYSHPQLCTLRGFKIEKKRVLVLNSWKWKLLCCVWLFAIPYNPWNSPGPNTGVGSLSLLQRIFPNQRSNIGLPHCRQIIYQLSYKGSPRIPEWVAYPFSSGSSTQELNWGLLPCKRILYQLNIGYISKDDFKEPRLLDFPIPRKVLSSLTWDSSFSLGACSVVSVVSDSLWPYRL